MEPTGRARVGPQIILVAQTGGQARERAQAPAAAAPTRPAGCGTWLQVGFAARAFGRLFRWLLRKIKTRPRFGKNAQRFAKY